MIMHRTPLLSVILALLAVASLGPVRAAGPTLDLTISAPTTRLPSGASWTYEIRVTTTRSTPVPVVVALTLDEAGDRVRIMSWRGARSCETAFPAVISCGVAIDAAHPATVEIAVQSAPTAVGEVDAWAWATLGRDGVLLLAQQEAAVWLEAPHRLYLPLVARP